VGEHIGESWNVGELVESLQNVKHVVQTGHVDEINNVNALFAVKDAAVTSLYDDATWELIYELQHEILEMVRVQGIALGMSPTSNDLLTRSLRRAEGWRIRELTESIGEYSSIMDRMSSLLTDTQPLVFVIANDNSHVYTPVEDGPLTVNQEYAKLLVPQSEYGKSPFGTLGISHIALLIMNSFYYYSRQGLASAPQSSHAPQKPHPYDPPKTF